MHHPYGVNINTADAALSIWFYFGPNLKTSMGKVVCLSAAALLRNPNISVRELVVELLLQLRFTGLFAHLFQSENLLFLSFRLLTNS